MEKHSTKKFVYLTPLINQERDIPFIKKILPYGIFKKYSKGSYILLQGAVTESIYYLAKGKVKVSVVTPEGKEKTYWYTLAGNFVGDVPFFNELPTNASIIAVEDCQTYVFDKQTFSKVVKAYPAIHEEIIRDMSNKIRVLVNQLLTVSFCKPVVQISRFLYTYSLEFGVESDKGIVLQHVINQSEIASINSLHRITVTKIMNKLRSDKVIDYDADLIVITDIERLHNLAFNM